MRQFYFTMNFAVFSDLITVGTATLLGDTANRERSRYNFPFIYKYTLTDAYINCERRSWFSNN